MNARIEQIEKDNIETKGLQVSDKLESFHDSFRSGLSPENGKFVSAAGSFIEQSIRQNFDVQDKAITPEIMSGAVNTVKNMYSGIDVDGRKTLGLKEISSWKINDACREANINQHAGFAAEVISTEKENFYAKLHNTGDVTYRADDLPSHLREQLSSKGIEIAAKNDQYVDKVRFKSDGTIEKVQTKFVGKDASSCLDKLMSKKYEKYITSDKVDKIEIPNEYYDEVKDQIKARRAKLSENHTHVKYDDMKKVPTENTERKIQQLNQLDKKLEKSCVTKGDALYSTEHPKLYAAKQINSHSLRQGAKTAAFTAAVSGVSNYEKYKSGEITGTEAVKNVVKDSAIAGGIAYGTEVVTQITGGSSVPGTVITMGVESYGDVKGYIDGDISGEQLAYNLGENAASIIGGAVGGTVGSVAGPVGSFAGAGVGSKATREGYKAAVDFVAENADDIKNTAAELGENILDTANDVKDAAADKADELKKAAAAKISGVFWD